MFCPRCGKSAIPPICAACGAPLEAASPVAQQEAPATPKAVPVQPAPPAYSAPAQQPYQPQAARPQSAPAQNTAPQGQPAPASPQNQAYPQPSPYTQQGYSPAAYGYNAGGQAPQGGVPYGQPMQQPQPGAAPGQYQPYNPAQPGYVPPYQPGGFQPMHAEPAPSPYPKNEKGKVPIRGFLIVYIIAQIINAVVCGFGAISLLPYLSYGIPFNIYVGVFAGTALLSLLSVLLVFLRKIGAKRVIPLFIIVAIADMWWFGPTGIALYISLAFLAASIGWALYFSASKRVKYTFNQI